MTRAAQKEQATTSLKTNSMNVNHVEYKQGFKFVEIRKMVSADPEWNILTCTSQNMDEGMLEMSKLVAVKIIQTFSQLMKRQS